MTNPPPSDPPGGEQPPSPYEPPQDQPGSAQPPERSPYAPPADEGSPFGPPPERPPYLPPGDQPPTPPAPGQPPYGQPGGYPPGPQWGQQPSYAPQPPYGQYGPPPAGPVRTNVLAILSLIFAFVFPPAGIVLGHLGKRQLRTSGEEGDQLATWGLILSYVFTALGLLACCGWLAVVILAGNDGVNY
ncbi:DUF4190 domain-containing protein [Micromonospora musae]|uniref:DUF4190 domain-containing protein n=1 Tax=Micromonospora musae TaxID=1894970 RepID=A0A3A9Y5D7_9ACTN|nr:MULTISPECIES: DUF4190 domain-containing protein [Micromonospora]RKN23813.1 DUF4190 domain-containing protein [Micromonospora musae]RKN31873.1 DUF4190 domain-containing protein [Micromonospora musae]TYB99087.1 DUF4190 domain-containing protein [Micromonospora sp. WP24]